MVYAYAYAYMYTYLSILVPCFLQRNTASLKPNRLLDFTVFFAYDNCVSLRSLNIMFHCHIGRLKVFFCRKRCESSDATYETWIKIGVRIRLCCGCFLTGTIKLETRR